MQNVLMIFVFVILTTLTAIGDDKEAANEQAKPEVKAADTPNVGIDTADLAQSGTWMAVTLKENVRLEQGIWGAGENHRQAIFTVQVDEVLRGTGSLKNGDKLKVRLNMLQRLIPREISNGVQGDKFLLGTCESKFKGKVVDLNHGDSAGNILLPYDAAQRSALLKAKQLPLCWSSDATGTLYSYWMSFPGQVPDPKYFDPSDIGVVCPKYNMPAYSVGQAAVAFELIYPGHDYYDFQELKDSVPKYLKQANKVFGNKPDKHVLRITVSNPTNEKITVPALRCIGDKVLWNNSVTIWIQDSGNKLTLNREKIEQKTEAVTLEPGKSISGMIDLLLVEEFPELLMYGWGSSGVSGVVALGNASSPLLEFSAEPVLVWGAYNAHAKQTEIPLATTDGRMNTKEIKQRIKEELNKWLK